MRFVSLAFWAGVSLTFAACDGDGEFDGGVNPDAGFVEPGPTAADIGLPCTFDRNNPSNPTNQCGDGLTCAVEASDPDFALGLDLGAWEDQFTTFGADTETGFCTLVGRLGQNTPQCPVGTALKIVSPGIALCLRECSDPSQCGRGDYTCDQRFIDQTPPACVRRCELDVPDCVRSGVFQQSQGGPLFTALDITDFTGASQCNPQTGQCEFVAQHGVAGPGEPCTRTEQCQEGAMCIQGPLLAFMTNFRVSPDSPGFCAFPCQPRANPNENEEACGHVSNVGVFCQDVGSLNLGWTPPARCPQNEPNCGPLLIDTEQGSLVQVGGFCFHQCELAVQTSCDAIGGTQCGAFDESTYAGPWNGFSMCLPDALRN